MQSAGLPNSGALSVGELEVNRSIPDSFEESEKLCFIIHENFDQRTNRIVICIGEKENCLMSWNITGTKDKDSSCNRSKKNCTNFIILTPGCKV